MWHLWPGQGSFKPKAAGCRVLPPEITPKVCESWPRVCHAIRATCDDNDNDCDSDEDSSGKLTLRLGMRFPLALAPSWKINFFPAKEWIVHGQEIKQPAANERPRVVFANWTRFANVGGRLWQYLLLFRFWCKQIERNRTKTKSKSKSLSECALPWSHWTKLIRRSHWPSFVIMAVT